MASGGTKYSPAKEHLFKVLVIGEFGVGKTSIIKRYVEGYFNPNYKLTIGVDFALKTLEWDTNTKVNLQLWDIAGHERFGHMTRVYYKYAIAAIIVFDLSRPATFDSIPKWLNDVNSKVMLSNEDPVPIMLLANKDVKILPRRNYIKHTCDVDDTMVDDTLLDGFCKSHNIIKWFPTSAKDNTNVDDAMTFLVDQILKLPADNQQPQDHISLPAFNDIDMNSYEESFEKETPSSHKKKSDSCCS